MLQTFTMKLYERIIKANTHYAHLVEATFWFLLKSSEPNNSSVLSFTNRQYVPFCS